MVKSDHLQEKHKQFLKHPVQRLQFVPEPTLMHIPRKFVPKEDFKRAQDLKIAYPFWWVGGVEWEYVTKMAKNDHSQEKHCKLLKSPIQRLYFVPLPIPKHVPRKSVLQEDFGLPKWNIKSNLREDFYSQFNQLL